MPALQEGKFDRLAVEFCCNNQGTSKILFSYKANAVKRQGMKRENWDEALHFDGTGRAWAALAASRAKTR
jgi:hypothetical protein